MPRVLLLIPPMTQLNTPYPATAYLTGFLRKNAVDAVQADPAIELIQRLLSRRGLERIHGILAGRMKEIERAAARTKAKAPAIRGRRKRSGTDPSPAVAPASILNFLAHSDRYLVCAEPVIRFLQGKDPSLAMRIASREFLPEGPRFAAIARESTQHTEVEEDPLAWAFGSLGLQDKAKYLASLFVDDLADVIRDGIDPHFEFSRYGESLAASAASFEPLRDALEGDPTLVDETLDEITTELIERHRPEVVGITAPFPGNVYGAFRIARRVRAIAPQTRLVLGGGYVNTELRELSEPRVFDYFDFVTLDDGEKPFLCLLEHLEGRRPASRLLRTFVCEKGRVVLKSDPREHDIPHRDTGTPTYDGLPLSNYLSILEMLNPMHRIWSDGRWNKLTLAHGCYWRKCNFCDVNLDYIGRYEAASADLLVDRIEKIVAETGQSGFHFVDEAAPPAVLRALAERLLARKVAITWWGNIRFEKTFTPDLTALLARSGCVAVSGGLEVASDRLLKLMNKGVTVEQVARVTRAFADAGVMVHAYLMYGFPTQTEQETVDSLERVKQLFQYGCIQSAYWHRFSATAHSPIGKNPEKFGIRLLEEGKSPRAKRTARGLARFARAPEARFARAPEARFARAPEARFAKNDLAFIDPTGVDHDLLGRGLKKALYNFMHGIGYDSDVRFWFERKVPKTTVPEDLILRALSSFQDSLRR